MSAVANRLMENTLVYRLWMAPFAERKLAPITARDGFRGVRRVLDVGCGPGTNARHFTHADYLGVDINERYIEDARRRHPGRFMVADVTALDVAPEERFDCILVNSLLHHIATPDVERLLAHLARLLADAGEIHILDLVLPAEPSVARLLARCDRGDFPRPLEEWRRLFTAAFEPILFEPYPLGALGTTLWSMVYFRGRARA
jgi:SAM-dependent methyltransferase